MSYLSIHRLPSTVSLISSARHLHLQLEFLVPLDLFLPSIVKGPAVARLDLPKARTAVTISSCRIRNESSTCLRMINPQNCMLIDRRIPKLLFQIIQEFSFFSSHSVFSRCPQLILLPVFLRSLRTVSQVMSQVCRKLLLSCLNPCRDLSRSMSRFVAIHYKALLFKE